MNAQDILTLLRAGYSKSEIDAMSREKAAETTKNETDNLPAETPQATQKPAPAPAEPPKAPAEPPKAPAEPPKAAGTELDRLFSELRNLTAAIQQSNRAAADMGANIIDPQTAGINALANLGNLTIKEEQK